MNLFQGITSEEILHPNILIKLGIKIHFWVIISHVQDLYIKQGIDGPMILIYLGGIIYGTEGGTQGNNVM